MVWMVVAVPLVGVAGVGLARRRRNLASIVAVAGMGATLVVAVMVAATEATGRWAWGGRLTLGVDVDGLAAVMAVLVPSVALPVTVYATSSLTGDAGLPRLLGLLLGFVAAMELLVAAGDLLTVLVGWELVSVCSWALITHEWRDPDRPTAAAQAFLTTRVGDLGLFAAAGLAVTAGAAAYSNLDTLDGWKAHVVAGGVLVAAAAKSAQVPFSPWLFSAMAGPTPVSALLHSATMVAAGAYLLARVVPVLDTVGWLGPSVAVLGLVTALAGGTVAIVQDDLKRALAASTSAQYGLILVAVGAGSTAAAGSHLVTHAAAKALLFLAAGVAIHVAGTGHLGSLRVGRAVPRTATVFAIGALALAAVPPLGGAWSKEEILAVAVHDSIWLGIGVLVAGLLSAAYAGRLAVLAFGPGQPVGPGGVTRREGAALGWLAGASVVLGLLWVPGAGGAMEDVTGGTLFAGDWWELPASLATIVAGVAGVVALDRRGALLSTGAPPVIRSVAAGWFGLPGLARHGVVDPVLACSRALARIDDRVIDAGVRAAGAVPVIASRFMSWWGERTVDGTVRAVAGGALRLAFLSRSADDHAVDRAVEDLARGTGVAGRQVRRTQTGLAHQYYLLVAAGLVMVITVAVLWR